MARKSADHHDLHTDGRVTEIPARAQAHAPAMLERLETYVRIETPTGDQARLNALADLVIDRHESLGATTRRVPSAGGDHLVIDHPGTDGRSDDAPVVLVGHHDTVWPVGALNDDVPWRTADGPEGPVIHGPGVYDMKSGLVIIETVLSLLAELNLPHRPVRVVVAADEEVGSPTATEVVTAAADGAIAALGFESPHPGGPLKVGRRGSTRLRVSVAGREAHAALDPDSGVSAIDELIDQLVRVRAVVAHAPGEVLCNVGTVTGGGKTNVVPANASADIGLRFIDGDTEAIVLDALNALAPIRPDAVVATEILSRRPAWAPSPATDALLERARVAAATVGQSLDGYPAAGAADTNTTGALGIPTLDGLGPIGAGAHARHEQVMADSLPERVALVTSLLATL